jgi:RNA-binding protein NOB1
MAAPIAASETPKPIHTIVLDSSPLLLNTPSLSTLRANSHELVTTPSVLAEIKHEEAKTRIETFYKPFLTVRTPKPDSLKFVRDFARRTGDGAVLSQTDYEIIAVAYEIECERNGGDWRLRNAPGQKRLNGSPPEKKPAEEAQPLTGTPSESTTEQTTQDETLAGSKIVAETDLEQKLADTSLSENPTDASREQTMEITNEPDAAEQESLDGPESGDSDDGWITPSNINKHKAKDEGTDKTRSPEKTLQVATMTGDFAMQNVLLQINLNLLSTKTCKRISQIKQFILRCHACFATTKDMSKQFCARCGKPTLTRVSCTTTDKGEVKLHLKANMQWNNRGNVFSVPKPSAGTANQKWQGPQHGGGKGGWGNNLILAEDQKEYIRAMSSGKRNKERDLMDEDTLPSILTGDRGKMGGRVKVGAGRNVNSRKR